MKNRLCSMFLFLLFLFCMPIYASTTCKIEDCRITITINMAFSGASQDYMDDAKNEIESVWNGNGRVTGDCKCPVSFIVNTLNITNTSQLACNPGPQGYHCIRVTPANTTPPIDTAGNRYTGYMYPPGVTNGPSINGWWSDNMSAQIPGTNGQYTDFAHEAGHMMGLGDDYNKSTNYYGKNIMGRTWPPDNQPNQSQIDLAVQNVCGTNACPDSCCCGNGQVEKNKSEGCDPFAEPNGCNASDYCCPVCCQCYARICEPQNGEYVVQTDCASACADGKCYYNYQTGCWDCLKQPTVTTPSPYDTTVKQVEGIFDIHAGLADHPQIVFPEPAADGQIQTCTEVCEYVLMISPAMPPEENMSVYLKQINQGMMQHPMLSKLFANEKMNIYLDGQLYGHAVTSNGQIIDVGEGPLEKPSINIYTNRETVKALATGELGVEQALEQGEIRYEGVGFFNSIKIGILKLLYDFFG